MRCMPAHLIRTYVCGDTGRCDFCPDKEYCLDRKARRGALILDPESIPDRVLLASQMMMPTPCFGGNPDLSAGPYLPDQQRTQES